MTPVSNHIVRSGPGNCVPIALASLTGLSYTQCCRAVKFPGRSPGTYLEELVAGVMNLCGKAEIEMFGCPLWDRIEKHAAPGGFVVHQRLEYCIADAREWLERSQECMIITANAIEAHAMAVGKTYYCDALYSCGQKRRYTKNILDLPVFWFLTADWRRTCEA